MKATSVGAIRGVLGLGLVLAAGAAGIAGSAFGVLAGVVLDPRPRQPRRSR